MRSSCRMDAFLLHRGRRQMNGLWRRGLILLVCVALSACSGSEDPATSVEGQERDAFWTTGNEPSTDLLGEQTTVKQVPGADDDSSGNDDKAGDSVQAFWDTFTGVWMSEFEHHVELPEEHAYAYTVAGLMHADPGVRYYNVYRMLDWVGLKNTAEYEAVLLPLFIDEYPFVQQAAQFVLDVMSGTLTADNYDWVSASPDGRHMAFYRYPDSRYNDRIVYILSDDGVLRTLQVDGSVSGFTWSPDNMWLAVAYGGRIWGDFAVYDTEYWVRQDIPDIAMKLATEAQYGYLTNFEQVMRFDPYVFIVEWSPDSSKFLFTYEFSDEKFNTHYGTGIYSMLNKRIEAVFPIDGGDPDGMPVGIDW